MNLNIGTSGYAYKFWGPSALDKSLKTDSYYPNSNTKSWLKKYSTDLKSVEINCTRYAKLKPESCKKWKELTPNDFTFTIKAPTYITHSKKLQDFQKWWDEFKYCIDALGEKFKCILFQFPPTFHCNEKNISKIQNVKKIIPKHIKCAFEFRNMEWFSTSLTEGIFQNNFTQTIVVVPEVRHLDVNFGNLSGGIHVGEINFEFIYIRFHGTYNYSCGTYDKLLNDYFEIIKELIDKKKTTVCVYFNNTDTWTTMPFDLFEGEFSNGIPYGRAYLPSAIYDSMLMQNLMSAYVKISAKADNG